MKHILLVGLGGCIGAVTRYKLGGIILHHTADWKFPFSTFIINISGCFVMGILAGLSEKHNLFTPPLRLFLFTGLLGGFTTFSAFGMETVYLLERHETFAAAANVFMSVFVGVFALWLGMKIVP